MLGSSSWKKFVPQNNPQSFWSKSIFGQYAHSVFAFCEEKDRESCLVAQERGYELNPYYNPLFSDYLRTWFLPYFPLITHMVFVACGIPVTDDTNNGIENYFGLLKTNIYRNRRHQKLSRFIRRQADVVKG